MNAQSLFLVSLPFAFEGKQRMEISEDAIRRMRSNADAVVQLPNERLKRESKDKSSQVGFEISHKYMTDAAESLWGICNNSGYCGLDFSSIHTILRSCDGFCHIASAKSCELDQSTNIVNDLINHPLMNKGLLLKGASGIVIFIRGSKSMRIDEVELIMDNLFLPLSFNSFSLYVMYAYPRLEDLPTLPFNWYKAAKEKMLDR